MGLVLSSVLSAGKSAAFGAAPLRVRTTANVTTKLGEALAGGRVERLLLMRTI
jgi:hypothetical protein